MVLLTEVFIYGMIGFLTFVIGLLAGYLAMTRYYRKRFMRVAAACRDVDSIEPLLDELERES
ncbi:MAG: hypothetical protein APR53_06725 [Methanoculleus sp. SDB]|nr:MAG: hypothetical protein APR53_06725 [Methanoculleus sp. SDB]